MKKKDKDNKPDRFRIDLVIVIIVLFLGPIIGILFSKTSFLDKYKPTVKIFNNQVFETKHKIVFSSTKSEDLEVILEQLNLNLENVKKGGLLPNFELLELPKDLSKIEPSKRRKDIFIASVLPIIINANLETLDDRQKLCQALKENKLEHIIKIAKKYGYTSEEIGKLKNKEILLKNIDAIPVSLAIAQAAVESGWGTSRFALEGNALYGQWAWNSKDGIKPKSVEDSNIVVRSFDNLASSVKSYIINLNTHNAYKGMRTKRKRSCDNENLISGLELANWMGNYATTRDEYIKILRTVISSNKLSDFDSIIVKNPL